MPGSARKSAVEEGFEQVWQFGRQQLVRALRQRGDRPPAALDEAGAFVGGLTRNDELRKMTSP